MVGVAKLGVRAVVVAAMVGALGGAAGAHPDVDAARTAFADGDFPLALKHLEDAERSPAATDEDRAVACWYRAASLHALGRVDEAALAIDRLLAARPLYQPDRAETPPRLRALFHERLAAYQALHGVTLGPPRVEGVTLAVEVAGHPEQVARVRAFLRPVPGAEFVPFDLDVRDGVARGVVGDLELWDRAGAAGRLAVVLEAHDTRGVPVARAGDALGPLELVVTPEQAGAARRALAPPVPAPSPVVSSSPTPTPAPPPAEESTGVTLVRLLSTPWKVMALASAGSGGCCFASGVSSVLAAFALPFLPDVAAPEGLPDPSALLALGAGLCCCLSMFSCASTGAFGGCTVSMLAAEVYYRRFLSSLEPDDPAEPVVDEEEELEP